MRQLRYFGVLGVSARPPINGPSPGPLRVSPFFTPNSHHPFHLFFLSSPSASSRPTVRFPFSSVPFESSLTQSPCYLCIAPVHLTTATRTRTVRFAGAIRRRARAVCTTTSLHRVPLVCVTPDSGKLILKNPIAIEIAPHNGGRRHPPRGRVLRALRGSR